MTRMHALACVYMPTAALCALLAQVLVVEKGHYTPSSELTWREEDAFGSMYERGGMQVTYSGGMHCQ